MGGAGLLLLGAAAGLGAIRFSLSPAVSPVHELAVWMATTVGMPLIGADYVRRIRPMIGPRGVGVLVVLAGVAGSPYGHSAYATVAAAAAMVGVLASSVWIFSPAGIAGALGVLSAGLALRPVCEALAVPFVPAYHWNVGVCLVAADPSETGRFWAWPGTCEVSRGRPTVPRVGFLCRAGVISGLSYRQEVANGSCPLDCGYLPA
jgi:hypothetical protein